VLDQSTKMYLGQKRVIAPRNQVETQYLAGSGDAQLLLNQLLAG
jgi:hypothetical protein